MSTKAAKKAAKKAATTTAPETIVEAGTPVIFTGFSTPIQGESELTIGMKVFVSSFNDDDKSYNVSKTPKGVAFDTLFRKEFRLESEPATASETANHGKNGGSPLTAETTASLNQQAAKKAAKKAAAKAAPTKTDAEADNGGSTVKDGQGRTVIPAKKAAKKAAKAAPAPEAPATPLAPVKLLPSVKAIIEENGKDLIKAAEVLTERAESTDYTLGGVLAKIQETGAFEKLLDGEGNAKYGLGQPGFANFVQAHLGVKYRKAQYLIGNYTAATACGITEKQMAGIGWSKFKEAVAALTAENKDDILAEAKSLPFDEFKAAMKKRIVNGGGRVHGNTNTAEMTTFTFRLHNDKAAVAVQALEDAKKALGIEGKDVATLSQAFDHIISEWVSMKG